MAEDNNQDMAMEDILSSIKNILEEDAADQKEAPVTAEEPLIDEKAEVNVEDILELSPDMRVEEALSVPVNETVEGEDINLEEELNNVNSSELSGSEDFVITDPEANGDQGVQSNVGLGWEDFDSDPFDAEPKSVSDELPEEPLAPIERASTDEEKNSVDIQEPQVVQAETVVETPVIETDTVQRAKENKAESDAVDVSASIISNFTKMFSQKEPETPKEPIVSLPAEPIKVIGEGAKTIEDVVADVIRQIIGSEVEKNWRSQANYDDYAREVIAAQTKSWLDANLPAVVEAIVKQEIERVMAKVGNVQ